MSGETAASSKVWRRLGQLAKDGLLRGLGPAELRAIFADVARARAGALTDADLIKRWREDRFLAPSGVDPRASLALQARLWDAVPPEFAGVELSPMTSLGTVSHLSGVGQNRVVTTIRGTELIFDPVHALALEASRLRRSGHNRVHLAACQRVAHAWDNGSSPQHETRLGLVSSAPDGGHFVTEADLVDLHLDVWRDIVGALLPGGRVEVVVWEPAVEERLADRGTRDGLIVVAGRDGATWRHPYSGVAFRIVTADGEELGDGGQVHWTQALTRNRKDRCVVSGVSVDLLLRHAAP